MDHDITLLSSELARYSRHFLLPGVGVAGQKKLKQARILCIGAGGLAAPVLSYLAAAGVGTLGIVDKDTVELSNIQRQVLFNTADISRKKAVVVKEKLQQLNPSIHIEIYDNFLNQENAAEIISDYEIVVDCSDNYPARYLINDVCFSLKKPNVTASVSQFEGQCTVFIYCSGPCYRCLYASPPPSNLALDCAEGGVLGVLPGLMGSIQATEVLKFILGVGQSLAGRLLLYNALDMQFREFAIERNPQCKLCSGYQVEAIVDSCQINSVHSELEISPTELQQLMQQPKPLVLLDVREFFEYDICHLNAKLIPLGQLEARYQELDPEQAIVVYCKVGGRSLKAVNFLKSKGFFHVKNLKGGIIAWIKEVDSSLLLY